MGSLADPLVLTVFLRPRWRAKLENSRRDGRNGARREERDGIRGPRITGSLEDGGEKAVCCIASPLCVREGGTIGAATQA
jgi:hypothetical protein